MARVARFNVTPVKSTLLHHPDEVHLATHGATGDRRFFLVDADGRRFSGAAKAPLLPIRASYDPGHERLELHLPDGRIVFGPATGDGEALTVDFYGRSVSAHVVGGGFAEAVSAFVGQPVRLVRPDREGEALDVRPVTLVSLESVAELARQGGREGALDAGRFRMTIEIEGAARPHEEDAWGGRHVRVGGATLLVETPVPRCVVTTLDPETAVRDFPTLHVIRRYRGTLPTGKLPFGVYASVVQPGTVKLGDPVEPV
ncbi:MAG TPA: MOSC domain-containing protein [Actinomycetota bacterium]|jgi:uncharacterized protein YcbX|nr:MOSC domain-containing protein [Actinomycetota bacterium]